MSKYSGKCDIYDSFIAIREMNENNDWSKINIKQYTNELDENGFHKLKELEINSLKDLVPYFPYTICSSYWNNETNTCSCIIGNHSYIYEEEYNRLQLILNDTKKYYKKCKRKNEEFIPKDVAKIINFFHSYEDIYLEICNRVKEHPSSATINGLHIPFCNYERDMLIETMMKFGYTKEQAYEWCYNENKTW